MGYTEMMKKIAEENGPILMVGHLLEYYPAVLKLKELISSKDLGKINYIYSNRLNFGKVRTEENALWNFAPHDVAVILRLIGCFQWKFLHVVGPTCLRGLEIPTRQILDFCCTPCSHLR